MNIFSFFAGAGFLDLGFETTEGFDVVYVSEYYKPFNHIYQYARAIMGMSRPKYGHHIEDITSLLCPQELTRLRRLVKESKRDSLTGFIGGPPCPDFSVAGRNRGRDGDNGKLSETYIDLICSLKPDFFLFENVKGLYRTARHRAFFEEMKARLQNSGFFLTEQLINSLEFGAAQDRDRIILIGVSLAVVKRLKLKVGKGILADFPWDRYKKYKKEEVLSLPWPDTTPYEENGIIPHPVGILDELTVQYWWDKNDVCNHPNANMFFRPKAGIVRFETKAEGDVLKKCYKRLHRFRYSPTAAYGNNEVHIHPYKPRRISVAEALAIQSLPKDFVLPEDVTLSDAFKTVGNGVPYLASKGIAQSLYDYLNKE